MSVSGIQGQLLEVTVVGCTRLKDTEWSSRQDPYVCLEYGSNKVRTRTCTDGSRNPTFQEKFMFTLIEGLRELNIVVWNSNTLTYDDFMGSGKIPLHKVLSEGFDDCTWPLQTKTGRAAGEARLIMQYANAKKAAMPSAPLETASAASHVSAYPALPPPQVSAYSAPPPAQLSAQPPTYDASYSTPPTAHTTSSPYPSYPANQAYPPPPPPMAYTTSSPYPTYPANQAYPPPAYPQHPIAYPPPPPAYPPSPYPPPPHGSLYYPPGHYPWHYPPPY